MRVLASEELGVDLPVVSNENFTLRRSQRLGLGVLGLLLTALVVLLIRLVRFEPEHIILLVVVVLIILVSGSLVFSRLRVFRRISVQIEDERRRLEETGLALRRVDNELQSRIDKECTERANQEWVDSTVQAVLSSITGILSPDGIAESFAGGLGRSLGADIVFIYTFGEHQRPRMFRQWHRQSGIKFDGSIAGANESRLSVLMNKLWNTGRVITVNDSHLLDVLSDPVPELSANARERTRSWITVPLAEGTHVIGYAWIAMVESVRVWSAIEIVLAKSLAARVSNILIQRQMFDQMMQIAEHEAIVGRLAELDKVKNDFIENMNHELRTPLTSIIGYVEMIIGDVDSVAEPRLAESLAVVQRNALRLQNLIVNMMEISKTGLEHAPLDIATVDIGNMLGEAIKSMELGAEDSGVGLVLRLDSLPDELLIDGDFNRLQQVFVNLLSNAIKFTPRGGKVTVVARHDHNDGDYVEVTVRDTGIGISPDEFPNMFKRFFRASTATQASIPGFGIGLSLVHAIVSEHDGTITFESTVGKGTMFMVRLPARHSTIEPEDEFR